ncbi:MAG: GAF domain-containing protein [Candidatus Thermoplasmatota archaeon]|jgi:GAF domain-containing protein|nr:GAF domain-containing protein [Candidatus Thermoplasmatota archaeon]MCL5790743.1 GAF domain-containing protein [Candidatus Thermoplasmatota archaeon]
MVTAEEFQKDMIGEIAYNSAVSTLKEVCDLLSERNPKFNWTGIYVVSGDYLILSAFHGEATEHTRIRIGEGLCSLAISEKRTVNEKDVKSNNEYLACFVSTNSEIVVPVKYGDLAVGEIDIDSDTRNAFDSDDEAFLEELSSSLAPLVKLIYDHYAQQA